MMVKLFLYKSSRQYYPFSPMNLPKPFCPSIQHLSLYCSCAVQLPLIASPCVKMLIEGEATWYRRCSVLFISSGRKSSNSRCYRNRHLPLKFKWSPNFVRKNCFTEKQESEPTQSSSSGGSGSATLYYAALTSFFALKVTLPTSLFSLLEAGGRGNIENKY